MRRMLTHARRFCASKTPCHYLFQDLNADNVSKAYGPMLMAQHGVHAVFSDYTTIKVLTYYDNPQIPRSIQGIPVEVFLSTGFEGAGKSFSLTGEDDDARSLSLDRLMSVESFEKYFMNRYGIHAIFRNGDTLNVIGVESLDDIKSINLPDQIENGNVDVVYYQGSPFDGSSASTETSGKNGGSNDDIHTSARVYCVTPQNYGEISTYGAPMTPMSTHPDFEKLQEMCKDGKIFYQTAGHGVCDKVSLFAMPPDGLHHRWIGVDGSFPRIYGTLEDAKGGINQIGCAVEGWMNCEADVGIVCVDPEAPPKPLPSFIKGTRDIRGDLALLPNEQAVKEAIEQLKREEFYAILDSQVVPVKFFGTAHVGPLRYDPWGPTHTALTIDVPLGFYSSDLEDFYTYGDSGAVVIDDQRRLVMLSVAKSHCTQQLQKIHYFFGQKSPDHGNVMMGHSVSVLPSKHWTVVE